MWKRERDERNDWSVKRFDSGQPDWEWTKREHEYDATGRLVKSGYSQWWEQDEPPEPDTLEHTYAGSRHIQNYDGSTYGERWQQPHAGPSRPGAGTPLNDPPTPDRAVLWLSHGRTGAAACASLERPAGLCPAQRPTERPAGRSACQRRERHLLGQGKALAKDSSGSGANWCTGIASDDPNGVLNPLASRLDFDGTVTATDLDRATDAREKGRIGILGSALAYAGSSPRITSEKIGRDVNPLGRGDGMAYVGGMVNLGDIAPELPTGRAARGYGNSINNDNDGATMGEWRDRDHEDACCRCVSGWCCTWEVPVRRWEPGMPFGNPAGSCCCPKHCGPECAGHLGEVYCPSWGGEHKTCILDDSCSQLGYCERGAG